MPNYVNCPCCSCVEDGCCDECVDCPAPQTYYDADVIVNSTSQSGSIAGSKALIACVSKCTTCNKVSPTGSFTVRVFNNTSKTIDIQFKFVVAGLSGSCRVEAQYNCSGPATYANGGPQNWFFMRVDPGATSTAYLDHRVVNTGCCSTGATISGFEYQVSEYVPPTTLGFCCDGNPGTGDNPGCDTNVVGQDLFEFCATYGGDCTMVISVGTCVSLPCGFCASGFAAYIVTSVYCDGIVCKYDATFSCCVPP